MAKSNKLMVFSIISIVSIIVSIFFLDILISGLFKYINLMKFIFIDSIITYLILSIVFIFLIHKGISYALKKQKKKSIKEYFFILTSILLTLISVYFFKIFFGRLRPIYALQPFNFNIFRIKDMFWSFPSMHTSLAMAFSFSLYLIYYKKYNNMYLIFLMPLVVGISRIIFLQHYFSDIIFAIFLGVFITLYSKEIVDEKFKKIKWRK